MSKRREEIPNPLLSKLLRGINECKVDQNEQGLKTINDAIDEGADALHNLGFGDTPFTIAVRYGLTKVVKLMMDKNIDPHQADSLGIARFVKYNEAGYNATALHVAAKFKQPEVAKILFEKMNCNFDKNNKFSPLHIAILNGDTNTATTLLQYNCDPNARDFFMGKNAYEWAEDYGGDNFKNFNFADDYSTKE
ncbi:MAG: ankyrin repeat domain-containing protein [Rickettsiaceae bacterium]|nr:ankyrin repeat domain-containing protein [Rickettsiaceae bacterium]